MENENLQPYLAWAARAAVGLLAATALHYTIYFTGSFITGIWERQHGSPVVYGGSPLRILLWLSFLLVVVWRGKPRLLDWVKPFTLWVGFWFLGAVATSWHPDSAEQAEVAAFSQAMFFTSFCLWSFAMLLALVRWVMTFVSNKKLFG